eukprot:scaffold22560_cov135-Cylindrotheca_fusiformis.AAC.27
MPVAGVDTFCTIGPVQVSRRFQPLYMFSLLLPGIEGHLDPRFSYRYEFSFTTTLVMTFAANCSSSLKTSIMDTFSVPELRDEIGKIPGPPTYENGPVEVAFPDQAPEKPLRQPSANDLGYGKAAPDVAAKYGYEDVPPPAPFKTKHDYDGTRQPRRSSLRGPGQPRRSSIGCNTVKTIEVRVRGERFPVQRRRSIDFARSVRVKEVTPVVKLNQNEEELWLQGDDFRQMKEDRKKIVRSAMNGSKEDIRGLEKYVDKSIRQAKQVAWDTVLIEQDEQEIAGHYSPEKLAEVYKHYTRESPVKAVHRAKEDQMQVQDYMNTPRTRRLMMRRLSC